MNRDFEQHDWDEKLEGALRSLLELAVFEDIESRGDLTSRALIPDSAEGAAVVRGRKKGIVAGLAAIPSVLKAVDSRLSWEPEIVDGRELNPGMNFGTICGPVRGLLQAERILLNLLGRLSGIASLTGDYVAAISGTKANIYDTRKTLLGERRLEKYAVRCGGGRNHRTGLFDAVLIKDNHLAFGLEGRKFTPADAVKKAREFLQNEFPDRPLPIIEIEVDDLEQLKLVLPEKPDIVLLDNMGPEMLKKAVAIRAELNPGTELEASGGINLETVRAIAETGIERISVGALTHSAVALDVGLDWE